MFNCELHILHIAIVIFKCFADVLKLLERFGELLFHLCNLHRRTNAGNDVLALSVCKEFAEKTLCAGSGVTRECNACTAVVAHVAERHHLNVYGCTP